MYILFTTPSCKFCGPAKEHLATAGIEFTQICAKENVEARKQYKVMSAPTLIRTNNDGTFTQFIGLDDIKAGV